MLTSIDLGRMAARNRASTMFTVRGVAGAARITTSAAGRTSTSRPGVTISSTGSSPPANAARRSRSLRARDRAVRPSLPPVIPLGLGPALRLPVVVQHGPDRELRHWNG